MGARGLTILSRGAALLFLGVGLCLTGCIVETAETGEEIGQVEGELSEAGDEANDEGLDIGDIELAAPEGSPDDNGDGTNPEPQPWHDKTTGAPGPDPGPDPMVQSTKDTDE